MNADRTVDAATIVTTSLAALTWLDHVEQDLRIIASVIAIIAGVCSAIYHLNKIKQQQSRGD